LCPPGRDYNCDNGMISDQHFVYVVDDDSDMREALADLLSAARRNVITFGSAAEYLAFPRPDVPACLLLDLDLPDMNGLDLQTRLTEEEHPHIVFLTGYGDVPSTARAFKAGAVDFLTKPCSDLALLGAVDAAIARDREARLARADTVMLERRLATLTARERDVFPLVVRGMLNKQAAAALGISEVTLQVHRRRLLAKMQAASVAELVRMSARLGIR
jgi:FixJ family two-component response regulator